MLDETPSGWARGVLGDYLLTAQGGGTPARDIEAYWNGDVPWASVKDLTSRAPRPQETITAEGLANSTSRVVPRGTNIIALRMAVGSVARYEMEVAINQDLVALAPRDNLDPDFLFHWLSANADKLKSVATGTTVKGLRKEVLLHWPIHVPPLVEQRKIAEVLKSVDEVISLAERQGEQAQRTLSAYAAEAFASTVSDDGSGTALEDLLTHIIDYRGVPPPKAPTGVPLLTAKNVRFGYLDPEPREYIAEDDYSSWMRRGIPAVGDVMFTTEAPLGNVADFPNYQAALGQRTLTLRADPTRLTSGYLKWLLLSPNAQSLIARHATGSTAKGIKQRTFRKLGFNVPALSSQREIAEACEAMWAVVRASIEQARAMTTLRRLVAKDLLSGHVRVPLPVATTSKLPVQPAFKRAVFAAEVVHQLHNDARFGSVKHEKIVHLCELHIGLHEDLDRHAYKEAAGPYDPKARRSVETIFRQQKWFSAGKPDGKRVVYQPLENCGGHASYFQRYFGDRQAEVQTMIDLLRPMNTQQCEIVATLYAVWNDFLIDGRQASDAEIVASVLNDWHSSKAQIAEDRWLAALPWMRQHGLTPKGLGEKTRVVAT